MESRVSAASRRVQQDVEPTTKRWSQVSRSLSLLGLHFIPLFCRYHQLSRNRRHGPAFDSARAAFIAPISTSSSNALHLYRLTTTHSQTFFLPACSFSTPPTSTSESKDASSPSAIPPAPLKAKVELRPGPIKPPIAPSSSQPIKTKKLLAANPSPQPQPTSSTAKPSNLIVEAMKEDLKQAYIHGVLARPPPGAGKVATLWHQAKELFVSSFFFTQSWYLPPRFRNSTFEVSSWLSYIENRPERFKHG